MEETISRMAGSSYGSYRSVQDLIAIAEAAGRPAKPRTTLYGEVPEERAGGRRSPRTGTCRSCCRCWGTEQATDADAEGRLQRTEGRRRAGRDRPSVVDAPADAAPPPRRLLRPARRRAGRLPRQPRHRPRRRGAPLPLPRPHPGGVGKSTLLGRLAQAARDRGALTGRLSRTRTPGPCRPLWPRSPPGWRSRTAR